MAREAGSPQVHGMHDENMRVEPSILINLCIIKMISKAQDA
jgi:hypothetical protein